MFEAVMIASTGLVNQQRRIDTIADNVSNVNTMGFKNSRLDFKDALYTAGIVPGPPRTPEGNQQKGHGVMVTSITRDFKPGSLLGTDREFDFAIEGEGFFELTDENGDIVYTRGGNFYVTPDESGTLYLVNSSGYFVNDINGGRITVPEDAQSVSIREADGMLVITGIDTDPDSETENVTEYRLGIYTFRNLMGLISDGAGNYVESAASGEKTQAEGVKIRQSYLEGSNVELATEMTRLIRAQRAFSLAGRALTTADDMEGIANNLKR